VEPVFAAPTIAEAAKRKGAYILQQCAVRGLETEAGSVTAAVTEHGPIVCKSVVLAGGAWSPLFAGSLNLRLPQVQAHATMMRSEPMTGPDVSAWGPGYAWRKQVDGGYTIATVNGVVPLTPAVIRNMFKLLPAAKAMWKEVDPVISPSTFFQHLTTPSEWPLDEVSPFEKNRILMPELRDGLIDEVKQKLAADFPGFSAVTEAERWGGVLVTTPDNMPVLDSVPEIPGLFLGTGFYYGLTMGAAAGEALADLVTGSEPKIDLNLYRYNRFTDGSALTFRV
jgi:glycine/D-amino acid oxidase-like deaminating enzyme